MQAMGAYGYRGLFQKKSYFIESIPYALVNIETLLSKYNLPVEIPELKRILKEISVSEKLKNISKNTRQLKVTVRSFSYKRGIPYDKNGNGGGIVFDCRFMENPGRIEKYKQFCGKDKEIINFLEDKGEVQVFMKNTQQIINQVIKKYITRKFLNLSIDFGCTGGQHRSVYCAEKTAEFLKNNFDIIVDLEHTEGF
jgi:RNase adaptor protein for sRNA GlmZ degradation